MKACGASKGHDTMRRHLFEGGIRDVSKEDSQGTWCGVCKLFCGTPGANVFL